MRWERWTGELWTVIQRNLITSIEKAQNNDLLRSNIELVGII